MPRTPTRPRAYISMAEAADYIGCNERTIRRKVASGDLTGYRLGKLLRVDRNELDALMLPIPTAGGGAA